MQRAVRQVVGGVAAAAAQQRVILHATDGLAGAEF
jgi:hypothetical protein